MQRLDSILLCCCCSLLLPVLSLFGWPCMLLACPELMPSATGDRWPSFEVPQALPGSPRHHHTAAPLGCTPSCKLR
jgi:hypothetical protein